MCNIDPNDPEGKHLEEVGVFGFLLGIGLAIGLVCCNLPQVFKVYRYKSTEGLSGLTVFITTMQTFVTVINGLTLKFWVMEICYGNVEGSEFWQCRGNLLTLYQLTGSFITYMPLMPMFIYYYKPDNLDDEKKNDPVYKRARFYWYFFCAFATALISVTAGLLATQDSCEDSMQFYGKFWGYMAALLNIPQWIPQILETYRKKTPGAVSFISIGIQMPGCLLLIFYQSIIAKENWSIWLPYSVAFCELVVLFTLMVKYWLREKKQGKQKNFAHGDQNANYTLLNDEPVNT